MAKRRNEDYVEWAHDGRVHATDDAMLFLSDGEQVWIPRKLILEWDQGMVMIPEWFAVREGLV